MRKVKRHPEQEKKVVGYIRVSTQEQAEDGESLERQAARIKAYCEAKGFEQPEIISDEGISGSKKNRPGFQHIVAMCKAGQLGKLIIYDSSRLNRDVRNAYDFFELVDRAGVEVHDIQSGGVIKTETATEKVQFGLQAVLSQYYRDIISDRTKAAIRYKKAKGEHTGGTIPFGFELVDGYRLIPQPGEYKVLKMMHSLRKQGLTLRAIVGILQEQGIPTKTGHGKWQPVVVMRILDRTADLICQDESLSCDEVDTLLHDVTGALYQVENVSL